MSNSNSIGIGVLGCGRIGVMHAELIAQRIEGAYLAGVYDVVTESAKKWRQSLTASNLQTQML